MCLRVFCELGGFSSLCDMSSAFTPQETYFFFAQVLALVHTSVKGQRVYIIIMFKMTNA